MTRRRAVVTAAVTATVTAATLLGGTGTALATDDTREPVVPASVQDRQPAALQGVSTTAAFSSARMATSLTTISTRSKLLGRNLSGVVVNPSNGVVTWSYRGGDRRIPASTQKLLTAYTVLHSMSPDTRFTTRVLQRSTAGGVFLVGGGDPSLSYARLRSLAATTATSLKANGRTSVNVYADATYFPARPTSAVGWRARTAGSDVQLVRGLALAGYRGRGDSSLAAAKAYATYLGRLGVKATVKGKTSTPTGSWQLASTSSPTVRSLVRTMLSVSSNDYAEFLLRHAARSRGYSTGWYGARLNLRRTLAAGGIPTARLVAYDGSGLSRANRMPMETLSAVIRRLWNDPADKAIAFGWGAMPRAGQTGTLYNRFKATNTRCARGRVVAKTGTLAGVVSLAGIAQSVDGQPRVFVLLENGQPKNSSVRKALDVLATTVVGCNT